MKDITDQIREAQLKGERDWYTVVTINGEAMHVATHGIGVDGDPKAIQDFIHRVITDELAGNGVAPEMLEEAAIELKSLKAWEAAKLPKQR